MDRLCNEIREYAGTVAVQKTIQLLEVRLQQARERNDASPAEDVMRNQGAIRELKWILGHIKPQ